jgi:epoxide hydrolase-like predicted phosphatase
MEQRKIKAVIFDIGGVLDKESLGKHYQPMCRDLDISFKDFLRIRKKHIDLARVGKITAKELIRRISKEMGVQYRDMLELWVKYKRGAIEKNKAVEAIIKKLKKNKYVLGSLTDVLDLHQKIRLEKIPYHLFDFNLLSYETGFAKPDPRVYRLLLKKLKLPPKEIVFIDDFQSCLDGAKKFGIKTILYKNAKQLARDLKKLEVKI